MHLHKLPVQLSRRIKTVGAEGSKWVAAFFTQKNNIFQHLTVQRSGMGGEDRTIIVASAMV